MKAVVSAARASDPAKREPAARALQGTTAGRRRMKARTRRAKRAVSGVLTYLIEIPRCEKKEHARRSPGPRLVLSVFLLDLLLLLVVQRPLIVYANTSIQPNLFILHMSPDFCEATSSDIASLPEKHRKSFLSALFVWFYMW